VRFIGSLQLTSLNLSRSFTGLRDPWIPEFQDVLSGHNTIGKLDISFNPIGSEGAIILCEILRANPHLQKVAFDGIEIGSPQDFIRMLDAIGSSPYIPNIQRPSAEIERLTAKMGPRITGEISSAWKRIKGKMNATKRVVTADESTTDALQTSDTTSISVISSVPHFEATWDVQIEIRGSGAFSEWEELSRRFTYEAITGVTTNVATSR
jgi:hypothetical protein